MLLKTDRLTIRHIVEDDWKSIKGGSRNVAKNRQTDDQTYCRG